MSEPVGRPSEMTEEKVKKLEEAFALDASIGEACFYADISKQTYYNWLEKAPELVERFEALRERPVLLARQSVIASMKENPDIALKYLERKKKDEFSTKQEIGITKEKEVEKALNETNDILTKLRETSNESVQGEQPTIGSVSGTNTDSGSDTTQKAS